VAKLESRLRVADKDLADARADLAKERKEFEAHLQTRIEEERLKWRAELGGSGPTSPGLDGGMAALLRGDSYGQQQRKFDAGGSMRKSHRGNNYPTDLSMLMPGGEQIAKSPSRRSIASGQQHQQFPGPVRTPTDQSLHSVPNGIAATLMGGGHNSMMPPPIVPVQDDVPTLHATSPFDNNSDEMLSPHQQSRTAAVLVSVSTSGAGPSVQLVERMSASVRRLEMEKALAREEIARLAGQRDEARDEVVELMREMDAVKGAGDKVEELKKELEEVKGRYEAVLEMCGEKSEECEELRHDVADLKKMYRDLIESSVGK
jgi:hypothetical protein